MPRGRQIRRGTYGHIACLSRHFIFPYNSTSSYIRKRVPGNPGSLLRVSTWSPSAPTPARPPPIAHPIPHPINLLIYHDDGIRRRSLSTDTPWIINNNQNDHVYAVFRK